MPRLRPPLDGASVARAAPWVSKKNNRRARQKRYKSLLRHGAGLACSQRSFNLFEIKFEFLCTYFFTFLLSLHQNPRISPLWLLLCASPLQGKSSFLSLKKTYFSSILFFCTFNKFSVGLQAQTLGNHGLIDYYFDDFS